MGSMQAVIEARNLSVVKGATKALNNASFRISKGKITGLIGPSGSGKTTLMRAMIGVQVVSAGALQVLGSPAGSPGLRNRIGYQPQSPSVYGDLTARQNVAYFARIFGIGTAQIDKTLERVDLMPQANQLTSSLSGGQLARVSLAIALLGNAELLVLDEPTVGLDPVLRNRLWALFHEMTGEGRTFVISSHVMDEAERCEDILLLRDGKVLSSGSKAGLFEQTKTKTVETAFLKLAGGAA